MKTLNSSEIIQSILIPCKDLQLGEFNVASACSTFIIQFYESKRKGWHLLKKFIKFLFYKNQDHKNFYRLVKNHSVKNVITFSTSRKTHEELLKKYTILFDIKDNHVIYNFKDKHSFSPNILSFLIAAKYCYQNKICTKFSITSLCLFLSVFELIINKRELDKYFKGSINKFNYICLNSAWNIEHIYTQYFKSAGCRTFTFQHAAFCDFEHALPIELNNYTNIASDYFLAWGEFTTSQVSKYFPDAVKVLHVGNPVVEDFFQKYAYAPAEVKSNIIFVALPRIFYKEEITDLLKLFESSTVIQNYLLKVRLHPSMSSEVFFECVQENTKLNIEIDEYLSIHESILAHKPDIIISFNSSIIFELLNFSEIIYMFLSKRNDFKIDQLASFSNQSELINLMTKSNQSKISSNYFFDGKDAPKLKKILAN